MSNVWPPTCRTAAEFLQDLGAKYTKAADALREDVPSPSELRSLDDALLVSRAMLRRHINHKKSSIHRLHPEILARIAYHLPLKVYLIHATHISSYFRNSLISHPGVWAHIDFKNAERSLAFFERSRSVPLHIDMSRRRLLLPAQTKLLHRNAMRIVTLELVTGPEEWELLLQPMPSLVRLKVTGPEDFPESEAKRIPPSLPSVTSLSVHDANPPLLHTPHLTRFEFLCTGSTEDGFRPESLFQFLGRSPRLEELEISYEIDFPTPDDRYISLPNLRAYTQTMPHGHTTYFLGVLDMLSLPPSCTVTLKSKTHNHEKDKTSGILPRLKNPMYLAEVRRVKLSMAPKVIDSRCKVSGKLELINNHGGKVWLERDMCKIGDVTCLENWDPRSLGYNVNFGLLNCLKDLNPRSIEILCIEVDFLWGGDAVAVGSVKEAIGRFPNIKTLVLSRAAARSCLLALDKDFSAEEDGSGFPRIETLVVHSPSLYNPTGVEILRALLPVVRKRKGAGYPFKAVSLFLWNIINLEDPEGKELEELRSSVGNFQLVVGDRISGWKADDYFLSGLEHPHDH